MGELTLCKKDALLADWSQCFQSKGIHLPSAHFSTVHFPTRVTHIAHGTTDWFKIGKGVCQVCILSACLFNFLYKESVQFSCSVASDSVTPWTAAHQVSSVQSLSRVRLCNPMNCSTPDLPVHHQLPEFTQTHVHRVGDAIDPSHPPLSPF